MYETKIIIPSRKGQGLVGLSVAPQGPSGPSVLDRLITGGIGLLVLVLAYTVIEPFLSASRVESQLAELESSFATLAKALTEFEASGGPYTDSTLVPLKGKQLQEVPKDPWGNDFIVDAFFRRLVSRGPNGRLETLVPGFQAPEDGGERDDRVFFYRPPGRLWVVREPDATGGGEMARMAPDGSAQELFSVAGCDAVLDVARTGDGSKVAVVALPTGGRNRQVALTDPQGKDPQFVTVLGDNDRPSWSPDGATLVFEGHRNPDGDGARDDLYFYNIAFRREERLTSGRIQFSFPTFHPTDADRLLAVAAFPDKPRKVCLLSFRKADSPKALRRGADDERCPVWSRDGESALLLAGTGIDAQIFEIKVSGRVETRLTEGPEKVAFDVSPVGDRMAMIVREAERWSVVVTDRVAGGRSVTIMSTPKPLSRIRWTP